MNNNTSNIIKLNRLKRELFRYKVIESKLSLYACYAANITSILMELDICKNAGNQNPSLTLAQTLTSVGISAISSTIGLASIKKMNDYENKIIKIKNSYKNEKKNRVGR